MNRYYPISSFKKNQTFTYVGMTNRKLQDKIKDHMTDIARGIQSTALFQLNLKIDIDIFFSKVRSIEKVNDYNTCILRESK